MTKKLTNQEFIEKVNIISDDYLFNDAYVNTRTNLSCTHLVCNNSFQISPNNFLNNGRRCPFCSTSAPKTNEKFISDVYEIVKDEYIFTENYKDAKTKLNCIHSVCKFEYKVSPSHFLYNGNRCPNCSTFTKKTNEQFKEEVLQKIGPEFVFLEEYKGHKGKIEFMHTVCGKHDFVTPEILFNQKKNRRCKFCRNSISKPSVIIADILSDMNIQFESEKKFEDCINIKTLPFDFYFIKDDSEYCIEYDGEHHFNIIEHWGGVEKLEYTQNNDSIKNKFCEYKGINLLRIPYTEDRNNFEKLIENFINKRSTTIPMGVGSSDPIQEPSL